MKIIENMFYFFVFFDFNSLVASSVVKPVLGLTAVFALLGFAAIIYPIMVWRNKI